MRMRSRSGGWLLAILLTLAPAGAGAGDFIDTRVSFTLADDNFLKDGGEQLPDSPRLSIGDRPGLELPFDNLDLATTGRENQLHLVLYKKIEGILPGLTTEAAATLEFNLVSNEFYDDSSYIRLMYALDPGRTGSSHIDLVMFPLSGDRFRIGYLYDLTWGGSAAFKKLGKSGLTPGFKVGGEHGMFYWWAGMKIVVAETAPESSTTEQGTTVEITREEALYSGLAGMGIEPIEGLSVDLSGGHIQQAYNQLPDLAGEIVTSSGLSVRLAYGRGLRVGLSSDLRLVRNDREYLESLSRRPTYDPGGGLSWRIALEGNLIAQVLGDPEFQGATARQWASAAALDARLQWDYWRINVTGVYRSLQFSVLNSPGLSPWLAFSEKMDAMAQIFGAASVDYHVPSLGLTPGLQVGVEVPGALRTELSETIVGSTAPPTLTGETTLIVRSTGQLVPLPDNEDRVPVYSGRLQVRWFASDILTLNAFLLFIYDENAIIFEYSADKTAIRVFDDAFRFGAGVTAQARF